MHGNVRLMAKPKGYLSQIADRPSGGVQVDIPTVGQPVGEHSLGRDLAIVGDADARLAQVIIARPGEVADDVGVVPNDGPETPNLRGEGLATHNNPVRVPEVLGDMPGGQVVVAGNVHAADRGLQALREQGTFRELVGLLPLGRAHHAVQCLAARPGIAGVDGLLLLLLHHATQSVRHRQKAVDTTSCVSGGVQPLYFLCDGPMQGVALGLADLRNFVAGAVEHHAGVVVVLGHHLSRRVLPELGEIQAEVVGVLGLVPHIRQLVHHQNTHVITGFQQGRPRRMVGAANGVEARLLQLFHAETLGLVEVRAADNAVVVMNAGSPELHGLAVDAKPLAGVQL